MTLTVDRSSVKQESKSQLKVLVFVTGDKGGTGKSTFSRGLLDILYHRDVACKAYDGDRRNPQLIRHYGSMGDGVTKLDVMERGGTDVLLEDMERGTAPVLLVDLPAGAGEAMEAFESEIGLIDGARELGYQVSVVSVLSRVKDSVNALRVLMGFMGERANYVAVKNLFFGGADKFTLFEQSKTKQEFLKRSGLVLSMPELFDETYAQVDDASLTFRQAAQSQDLSMAHRRRVYLWLENLEKELTTTERVLGLGV
jgi:hypothetical protein